MTLSDLAYSAGVTDALEKVGARRGVEIVRDLWNTNKPAAVATAKRFGAGGAFKDTLAGTQLIPMGAGAMGAGAEGVATPVLGSRGIDVRKHYFPKSPFTSKQEQDAKEKLFALKIPGVSRLNQTGTTATGDRIHRVELALKDPSKKYDRPRVDALQERVNSRIPKNLPLMGDLDSANVMRTAKGLRVVDFTPIDRLTGKPVEYPDMRSMPSKRTYDRWVKSQTPEKLAPRLVQR